MQSEFQNKIKNMNKERDIKIRKRERKAVVVVVVVVAHHLLVQVISQSLVLVNLIVCLPYLLILNQKKNMKNFRPKF